MGKKATNSLLLTSQYWAHNKLLILAKSFRKIGTVPPLVLKEILQPVCGLTTGLSVAAKGLMEQHAICLINFRKMFFLFAGRSFTGGLAMCHGALLERAAGHDRYALLR